MVDSGLELAGLRRSRPLLQAWMALWLVWRRRQRLRPAPGQIDAPSLRGPAIGPGPPD